MIHVGALCDYRRQAIMKQFDAVHLIAARKQPFVREVFRRLMAIQGVISVTFVGSFCGGNDLSGISDIDVVVVCEILNQKVFDACAGAMSSMTSQLLELPNHSLHVNTTFGPLKFDKEGLVIIHLMVYDRAGHRSHVLKSPFTCLDWERSGIYCGLTLAEIYPVLCLQPDDFVNARRSLTSYTDDLRRGVLSCRSYLFTDSGISERLEEIHLDQRLRGEYAFHIVKNLVQNYYKYVHCQNIALTTDELVEFWREYLPSCAIYVNKYLALQDAKLRRVASYSTNTLDFAKTFIENFQIEFSKKFNIGQRIIFVRHAKTGANDGSFLGQGRNPGILTPPETMPHVFTKVYCSPLLRAMETAEALQPNASLQIDIRLTEINYGVIEGITFDQLALRHTELVAAWSRGEDVPFPGGENTADVQRRLEEFLASIHEDTESTVLVVTHNVVIRCLLGKLLGVPIRLWYKLRINHLDPFEVMRCGDRLYLNLTGLQKAALTDSLVNYRIA
jgi:broad specificity phosphatase PhoE